MGQVGVTGSEEFQCRVEKLEAQVKESKNRLKIFPKRTSPNRGI